MLDVLNAIAAVIGWLAIGFWFAVGLLITASAVVGAVRRHRRICPTCNNRRVLPAAKLFDEGPSFCDGLWLPCPDCTPIERWAREMDSRKDEIAAAVLIEASKGRRP